MSARRQSGISLIEITVVVAVVAVIALVAPSNLVGWSDAQRVKSAARSVADAFTLARSEAIRTASNHLVIFGMAMGATAPIVIVNDGAPSSANCKIDSGEVVHTVRAEPGVSWGTSTGAANGTPMPDDSGDLTSNAALGWSFANASGGTSASWVLFQPDGLPRTFTSGSGTCAAIGNGGEGGGGIYVTNGERDYAVLLRPLGTVRVHKWDPNAGAWRN